MASGPARPQKATGIMTHPSPALSGQPDNLPPIPRIGATVTTPDGEGVFMGAADLYRGESLEGTYATVLLPNGDGHTRRVYELDAVREA